jgi:DNA-binding CsgD family transcriptional regulator
MLNSKSNFTGSLDGTTVNEINKKLDYTKTNLEDRKNIVNDILDNTSFYQKYFDDYYNPSPTNSETLSEENNVCKSLEAMANYLLNSDEVKEEKRKNETKYVFYTDTDYFKSKMNREPSIENLTNIDNIDCQETIIHFFKREEKNYKKAKDQKITAADLKKTDDLGEILREYNEFLEFVSDELRNKNQKNKRYVLTNTKHSLEEDMIYCKNHLLGVFGYEIKSTNETTKYDLDVFDFTNELHLKGTIIQSSNGKPIVAKGLIYLKKDFNPEDEMSYVLIDLQRVIDRAGLTNFEKDVLELLRNGWNNIEIAKEFDVNHVKIYRTIRGIIKKIISVGDKYDAAEN